MAKSACPPRWEHQEQSYQFFLKRPRGFDNSAPGTGKTRVQIDIYNQRKNRKRWLILCPMTLMEPAWGVDIEKYAPNLTVSFAKADNREEAFAARTDVVVLNIDGVKWFADKATRTKAMKYLKEFDHLTIDEYTAYKHANSQRSKAIKAIAKQFTYRYGMSGTPNSNTVMELFHPALIIDDGKRLGTSYFALRSNVQVPTQIGPRPDMLRWDDKPGVASVVAELLQDITIRHPFSVMKHVPANFKEFRDFELSKRMRRLYDQMESECILAFDDGAVANAVHAASLRNKLLQIASGAVYANSDDPDSKYQLVDIARYELACDIIEESPHSVVFFNWTHQRDFMLKELEKRDLSVALIDGSVPDRKRAQIVADYQDGKYRTILLHPRTGAHGLTLTRGDTTIFTSPIYEVDLMEQGIARIWRGAQDKETRTIFLRAKRTVEETKVYPRLFEKLDAMNELLDIQASKHKPTPVRKRKT